MQFIYNSIIFLLLLYIFYKGIKTIILEAQQKNLLSRILSKSLSTLTFIFTLKDNQSNKDSYEKLYTAIKPSHNNDKSSKQTQNKVSKKIDTIRVVQKTLVKAENIPLIGIGGGGCNIVEYIYKNYNYTSSLLVDSDIKNLSVKNVENKLYLLKDKAYGCGKNIDYGIKIIDDDVKKILENYVSIHKKVFLVFSLEGSIGSGATQVLIEYLKYLNKEIIVFLILPFKWEGKKKYELAQEATNNLVKYVDKIMIFNNSDLSFYHKKESFFKALEIINKYLYEIIIKELFYNQDKISKVDINQKGYNIKNVYDLNQFFNHFFHSKI